jgi:hypothetical protein
MESDRRAIEVRLEVDFARKSAPLFLAVVLNAWSRKIVGW